MSKVKLSVTTGNNGKNVKIAGQGLAEIPGFVFKKYGKKVESLDFSGNGITVIKNLNEFSSLKTLILDSNKIAGVPKGALSNIQFLENFSVNDNLLDDFYVLLDELSHCSYLKNISLLGNPGSLKRLDQFNSLTDEYRRFRFFVIHNNPSIENIDGMAVLKEEREKAKKVGMFCRVKKMQWPDKKQTEKNLEVEPNLQIHSYFGYTKKEYLGLNSQGNRFIKDL